MEEKKAPKPKKTAPKKETKDSKDNTTKVAVTKKTAVAKPTVAVAGHMVSVEYTGTLSNGEEFDSSKNNGPISFIIGSQQVIKGFDDAVVGMKVDQSKKFNIKKEDAYGDVNPQLLHKIPSDKIPEDIRKQVKVGGFLVMQSPVGQQIPAKVKSITDNEITLDLNHPLAGKDLTFDIKIVDISVPSEHDLHHGHDHGHDHHGHDHNHNHEHAHDDDSCECGDDGECDDDSDDCCGGSCNCK
jgi:peptidylprolyl isomerase